MRKGKIAAQCAHASLKVFLDRANLQPQQDNSQATLSIPITSEMEQWVRGSYAKICVSVDSDKELLEIYKKAQEANLPCSLIVDEGRTEFHGVPTHTSVAIGPARSEDIDPITKGLKLL